MSTAAFALIIGIVYLLMGLMGLVPASLRPLPADAPQMSFTLLYGGLLGLFVVNVLHSAIHLAIGVWGVMAWRGTAHPVVFARSLAMFFGALAVLGMMPGMNTMFGLLPLYGHNVWLHAGTALAAAYFGWRSQTLMERRQADERRRRMLPVDRERRFGLADRRHLAYTGA